MVYAVCLPCFVFHSVSVSRRNNFHATKKRKPLFVSFLGNCWDIVYTFLQVFLLFFLIVFPYFSWHMNLYFKPDLSFSAIINILCCWTLFFCHCSNCLYLFKAMLKSLRSSLYCWPSSSLLFLCIWLVVQWLHPRALQNNDYIFLSLYAVSYVNFSQSQYNVLLLCWWLPAPSLCFLILQLQPMFCRSVWQKFRTEHLNFKVNLNKMEVKLIISWQKIATAPSATM